MKKTSLNLKLERFRFLVLPVGLVVFILASFFFLVWPKIGEVQESYKAIEEAEERLDRLNQKLSVLEGLEEGSLERYFEIALLALPKEKEPLATIGVLRQIIFESGLDFLGAEVDPGLMATTSAEAKEKKETPFLTYSFRVTGSLDEVEDFVLQLEKTFPLLQIGDISLQRLGGDFSVSSSARGYYFYLSEDLGKLDTPVGIFTEKEDGVLKQLEDFNLVEAEVLPSVSTFSAKRNPFI